MGNGVSDLEMNKPEKQEAVELHQEVQQVQVPQQLVQVPQQLVQAPQQQMPHANIDVHPVPLSPQEKFTQAVRTLEQQADAKHAEWQCAKDEYARLFSAEGREGWFTYQDRQRPSYIKAKELSLKSSKLKSEWKEWNAKLKNAHAQSLRLQEQEKKEASPEVSISPAEFLKKIKATYLKDGGSVSFEKVMDALTQYEEDAQCLVDVAVKERTRWQNCNLVIAAADEYLASHSSPFTTFGKQRVAMMMNLKQAFVFKEREHARDVVIADAIPKEERERTLTEELQRREEAAKQRAEDLIERQRNSEATMRDIISNYDEGWKPIDDIKYYRDQIKKSLNKHGGSEQYKAVLERLTHIFTNYGLDALSGREPIPLFKQMEYSTAVHAVQQYIDSHNDIHSQYGRERKEMMKELLKFLEPMRRDWELKSLKPEYKWGNNDLLSSENAFKNTFEGNDVRGQFQALRQYYNQSTTHSMLTYYRYDAMDRTGLPASAAEETVPSLPDWVGNKIKRNPKFNVLMSEKQQANVIDLLNGDSSIVDELENDQSKRQEIKDYMFYQSVDLAEKIVAQRKALLQEAPPDVDAKEYADFMTMFSMPARDYCALTRIRSKEGFSPAVLKDYEDRVERLIATTPRYNTIFEEAERLTDYEKIPKMSQAMHKIVKEKVAPKLQRELKPFLLKQEN